MRSLNAKRLVLVALLAAFLGFLDATYLTVHHYLDQRPPCAFAGSCEDVLTSSYAQVANVPVAAIGVLHFLSLAGMLLVYIDRTYLPALKVGAVIAFSGVLLSAWFLYLQVFVLKAICLYCIGSAVATVVAGVCARWACKLHQQQLPEGA